MTEGREYTFGVSGKLIMIVQVMYDRPTDSLWSQLSGQAVEGPLAPTELEFVESLQTTWAEWKDLHPNAIALRKGFSGARDIYDTYYESNRAGERLERAKSTSSFWFGWKDFCPDTGVHGLDDTEA